MNTLVVKSMNITRMNVSQMAASQMAASQMAASQMAVVAERARCNLNSGVAAVESVPQKSSRGPLHMLWLCLGLVGVLLLQTGCGLTTRGATRKAAFQAQYAYVRADMKSELVKFDNYSKYERLQTIARRHYLKATRAGLKGLNRKYPGFEDGLLANPQAAAERLQKEDMDLIYWTGAAWLAAISISLDNVALVGQLPQPTAMLERALVLDPDYDQGALHEIFLALDMSRSEALGGGEKRAIEHYQRAIELSKGKRASVFVAYASSYAVKLQKREIFDEALKKALAIDVSRGAENRLVNRLSQKKARYMQQHAEDLFDSSVLELEDELETAQPENQATPETSGEKSP